jgi:hypothetical protein
MKVQYNSLTMLLSSFMQEFGPISSRVYCIFAQITNNLMKSRDKLHQRFLKTRCKRDWEMYRECRNNVKVMLKEAAINHLSDEVKVHKNNPGSL